MAEKIMQYTNDQRECALEFDNLYRTPLKAITTSRIFPAALLENPKKLRLPLKQTYYCMCI